MNNSALLATIATVLAVNCLNSVFLLSVYLIKRRSRHFLFFSIANLLFVLGALPLLFQALALPPFTYGKGAWALAQAVFMAYILLKVHGYRLFRGCNNVRPLVLFWIVCAIAYLGTGILGQEGVTAFVLSLTLIIGLFWGMHELWKIRTHGPLIIYIILFFSLCGLASTLLRTVIWGGSLERELPLLYGVATMLLMVAQLGNISFQVFAFPLLEFIRDEKSLRAFGRVTSELGRVMLSKQSRAAATLALYRQVRSRTSVQVFELGFVDADRGLVTFGFVMHSGTKQPEYQVGISDVPSVAMCLQAQCPVIEAGKQAVPIVDFDAQQFFERQSIGAIGLVCFPLLAKGRVVALLKLTKGPGESFNYQDFVILRALAGYMSVAFDNIDTYERLQDAQQQLVFQEKMSAVATLTAGVSHEISASVDRAHASAQALEREIEDFRNVLMAAGGDASPEIAAIFEQRIASMQTQLGTMIVGTSRVRDIATDLRTFSRLDASKPVHATLADSLLATVQLVQSHIQGSTRIECYLSANPMVECWPEQLNQVFMNLIINACHAVDTKYADTSRRALGLVKISSEVVNEQLAICVEDNGSGIDPKVINRIFDPFYTTKQIGEGSGLGLSISFGIVEKHHGQIKVASVPGEGSKFTVMIPLRQPVTAE